MVNEFPGRRNSIMKIKNGIIIVAVIVTFFLTCSFAAAETINDPSGDVYHWRNTGTGWSWDYNVGNKPDIDITEVSAVITGSTLTLTIKVTGDIQNSEKIAYWAYYNSTDTSYWMYWTNGEGYGFATQTSESGGNFGTGEISASGDTVTGVFDIIGDDTQDNFYAYAYEYTVLNDVNNEWWGDWVPNDQSPYTSGSDDSGDDETGGDDSGDETDSDDDDTSGGDDTTTPSTPGFEAVLLILAFVSILFIIKRKS